MPFIPHSPTEVTNQVKLLLEKFSEKKYELVYVPIKSEPTAVMSECYNNVREKIKSTGGKIRFGWSVYDNGYFIEAEKHAIWENPERKLICVSPNLEHIRQLMFIMDDNDDGIDVPNIRYNYTGSKIIDDFFLLFDIKKQLLIDYGIPLEDGRFDLHPALKESYDRIDKNFITCFQIHIASNLKDSCLCGKSLSYDDCHSKHFISDIIYDLNFKISKYKL